MLYDLVVWVGMIFMINLEVFVEYEWCMDVMEVVFE